MAQAQTLVTGGHSQSDAIDARRQSVVAARMAVCERAARRRAQLNAAADWAQLKRDGDELRRWIEEKSKVAADQGPWPPADAMTVARRRLQKHEAFELELRANADRVDTLQSEGNVLIDGGHYAAPQVKALLAAVAKEWAALAAAAKVRGEKLMRACERRALDGTLADVNAKLDEMTQALQSTDVGADLR